MISRYKTMFAALVAVFALAAVASASASAALPEFVPEGGKFPVALEGNFTTAETNWSDASGSVVPFTGSCKGVKVTGSIEAAKSAALSIEGKNCQSPAYIRWCFTPGSEEGVEIISGNASLVYISKSKKELGLLFATKATTIHCGTSETDVQGSLIIPVTPVNTKTSKVDLLITSNKKGKNTDTSYENEKGEVKHAWLELEVGAGFSEAAFEVEAYLNLTASKSLTVSG